MHTEEKALLLVSAAFAVLSLIFTLYIPKNALFFLPMGLRVALYAAAGAGFLFFVKFRRSQRLSLVFFWVLCAVFILCAALFSLAVWSA